MKNKNNILRERPRKKNNKKITKKNDISTRLVGGYRIQKLSDPKTILLNIGLCEKPEPMSKVQAFIIIALTLLAFVGLFKISEKLLLDSKLRNCEIVDNCSEVIREMNRI